MAVFRALLFGLLLASALSFAMYAGTGTLRWKRLGLIILKWTLAAALGFFAVLIVQRLVG